MGFRENRALGRLGLPEYWERGPGPLLEDGEAPISYAHYELQRCAVVGVFLTDRNLYVLDVVDMDANYERLPGIPLTDLALAGRVNGPGGGWAFTRLNRYASLERGPANQVISWLLYPRAAFTARMVSRTFLRELKRTVGPVVFVDRIKLSREGRGAGYRFDEEMLERACLVSAEVKARVEASSAFLAERQRQEDEDQAEREAAVRQFAEQERLQDQERLKRERREAAILAEAQRREARIWRAEGSPEKRRRRAEWRARQQLQGGTETGQSDQADPLN